MLASDHGRIDSGRRVNAAPPDPTIRGLLDHIAAELAEEYIRLMEAAAEPETASETHDADA